MPKWEEKTSFTRQNKNNTPKWIKGVIPKLVGIGESAKTSLLVIVVILSFSTIGIVFLVSIGYDWYFKARGVLAPNIISIFNNIWDTVSPIIILALGYQFGKNQNKH